MAISISNSQTLISLLLSHAAIALFVTILATANTAQSQTVDFGYYFDGRPPQNLAFQGGAHFPSDLPFVRLTKTDDSGNAVKNGAGRIVYQPTVPFWRAGKQATIETTINFIIRPNAGSGNDDLADGIAFFIAPVGTTIPSGSLGGNFGVFNTDGESDNVFAVEFDTYANDWDPKFRHIGIDFESVKSVAYANISDGLIGKQVTLRVSYEEATHVIKAVVYAENSESESSEVSFVQDLKGILEQDVQVGIAASTGAFAAIHDIVSWHFTATLVNDDHANGGEKYIRKFV